MLLSAYRAASWVAGPLISLYLRRRLARGREHPERFGERLGHAGLPRPAGELLWCHAASVGEAVSVLPLLERFWGAHPDWTVLLTTGTLTSAELVAARAGGGIIHQFVPVDRPAAVARFLDHWRPSLALWVESELWPNLIRETRARGVPMALVNARMSDRSFRNWQHWRRAARSLLGAFDLILAQSAEDAKRLMALGAPSAATMGNLKAAAPPLPVDDKALRSLRAIIGNRPCWLAASVHPEEIEDVTSVQRYLTVQSPDYLTIIVPRHPERGVAWADAYFDQSDVRLRSAGDWPDSKVYIADTLGELGLFYRLAPISFVGGSFAPIGGHNPLEPARLGSAILFGPYQENFREVSHALRSAGGAHMVADFSELARAIVALHKDQAMRMTMVQAAARVAAAETSVLDHVQRAIEKLIPSDDARS
jgi:3-deoxy-D-manno-octulosonic-acid transferase